MSRDYNKHILVYNKIMFQIWLPDSETETWRSTFETEFTAYTSLHYKNGTCSVFAKQENSSIVIIACIEDHSFQAKNFWFVLIIK